MVLDYEKSNDAVVEGEVADDGYRERQQESVSILLTLRSDIELFG
jgi:hypothetical protein